MTDPAARWFRTYRGTPEPTLRLVCFPHAGGAPTAYRSWAGSLPEDIELLATCYPGRQDRIGEPFAESVHTMADAIAAALRPLADAPLALFGHSMGAVVAHEVALRLQSEYGISPVRLFVSGSEAPHRREREKEQPTDDAEFLAELRELGHSSLAAIDDPLLLELVMPSIRSDYRLSAAYHPVPDAPKHRAPLVAYVGAEDSGCTYDELTAWSEYTQGAFETRVLPGDHFYLQDQEQQLLAHITGHLQSDLRLQQVLAATRHSRP
ncbi:thioesterase II family protein [Streptomyces sp. NRRL B-3229]|uniref:thioesterase II family protein n=1 Tax=Streptomyces sp. NRRL B-3229 TaxID=1463836 RepID=UPI00068BED79|nr:alpha/beta fold hydrolase [Streptomyces sp. NRRL B-3229]